MARLTAVDRKMATDAFELANDDARLVQGLARGLALLRTFQPGETTLSNGEMAERSGLSRPTISRLTQTLVALGYLSFQPGSGRYQLGAGVVSLCHSLLAGFPHRIAARPVLQEIADIYRIPASLGMRDQLVMLTIETARHPHMRPARFDLGSRLPIEISAMGRAFLYALPADEREALLRRLSFLWEAPRWDAVRAKIEASFDSIAKRGFCIILGERQPDVYAVGAPVFVAEGAPLALNCGGMPSEVSADQLERDIGPRLAAAAREVSMEMVVHRA